MSKYVECQLDITRHEFEDALHALGYQKGTEVKMYKGTYEVEVSADNKVGLSNGKLIFDDMFGGRVATRIMEHIYTNRIRERFGEVDISRVDTGREVILRIRR